MSWVLYGLIIAFGCASYVVGLRQMLKDKYAPSTFSRVVWLLLAVNSFAAVTLSHSTFASVILAGVLLAGNAAICALSFWKGSHNFGRLEIFCLALLVVSGVIWIVFDVPLVNLGIGLLAHLIGALPTYRKVIIDSASESTSFWSLFFIAAVLSVVASLGEPLKDVTLPIYFTLFDGSIFILSIRRPKLVRV